MLKNLSTIRNWTIIGSLCLVFNLSLPAQADTKIDPQLEQQVLEIIRQHPETILDSLRAYQQQQQQKLEQVRQEFLQELQNSPRSAIASSPITDANQTKTILIEFSDFQCPYCAQAHQVLQQLLTKYPHRFALVYKFFPLTQIHPQALSSAKAAWAAAQQGKFWQYHDALFANQKRLGEPLYLEIAKNLGLNLVKFNHDRNLAVAAIDKDLQLAEKLQVAGTPYFLLKSPDYIGAIDVSDVEQVLQRSH